MKSINKALNQLKKMKWTWLKTLSKLQKNKHQK